ncbi:hypothetical protein AU255_09170 [Methyloprofundus sedimenti]|uniref:Uncharacterized protein n=1 Tax=Methyloprofundus sedimenti TaxID=1420851 RepID=A0A1V8M901_9GAMM|nr:hypothetical protein [Methyloprofundus sedimenti]OQK18008.1 hypothetical protein AU255_09170 [Methyloprofundus sedimenti]
MSQLTEQNLIDAALAIGNIADSNGHYTAGLAARIDATGKTVFQLTIIELLALDHLQRIQFNGRTS